MSKKHLIVELIFNSFLLLLPFGVFYFSLSPEISTGVIVVLSIFFQMLFAIWQLLFELTIKKRDKEGI